MKISSLEAGLFAMFSDIALNLGESFCDTMDNIKAKILNPPQTENPYFIMMPGGCSLPNHPLFKEIEASVCQHEKIEIKYRGGSKPKYRINPLRIVWSEGFWYLLAQAEEGQRIRSFLVDKITLVHRMGIHFVPPPDVDMLLASNVNIWISAKRNISAVLEISAKVAGYFKQRPYFPEQTVREMRKDGSMIIECRVADTRAIFPVVLSWLPHIRIISPNNLREELKNKIAEYLANI